MHRLARDVLFLLFCLIPVSAASDDQQKARKILNKLTAMAIDPAGKRAVSQAMSQQLSVTRDELAQRRHAMNLNYGDLFVAYEVTRSGMMMDDLADKIKTGKTVWQAANDVHADWKRITTRNSGLEPAWGEARSIHWKSDGYDVQGWLIYPRAFDVAKRYPLVVSVHGGPGGRHGEYGHHHHLAGFREGYPPEICS